MKRVSKLFCVATCFFAFAATSAPAEITHKLLFNLDGGTTPAGSFLFPEAVYVDGSSGPNAGDVYVNDSGHHVVNRFSSSGAYECQITGAGSATTSPSECDSGSAGSPGGLPQGSYQSGTIDPTTGNIYLPVGNAIDVFNPAGAYLSQIPESGAVASSASTGDLLIGQNKVVDAYDPATSTLSEFASQTPAGPFGSISAVAVDNDPSSPAFGDVYVADRGKSVIDVFDSSGAFLRSITGAPGEPYVPEGQGIAARMPERLAVDPASGELYVQVWSRPPFSSGLPEERLLHQFSAAGAFMGRLPLSEGAGGIAVDGATGHFYVADAFGVVNVYGPSEIIPTVATGAATGVGRAGATLEGTVNPDGVAVTDCHFDYGATTAYGQTAPCVPGAGSLGSDSSDHIVTADLAGLLKPGTSYHFRLEAVNASGPSFGQDMTFSTTPPPSITGALATNVTAVSADLKAQINPNGNDTNFRIEWGPTTAYGNNTPVPDADIGSGTTNVSVTRHITGLNGGTTYHWRVVATNLADTTTSPDHTLIYDTSPPILPDSRAYELVTPLQKNGSQFDVGLGLPSAITSQDGNRVMVGTIQCFAGATSCTATRQPQGSLWSLDRTAAGWRATPASPPATQFASSSIGSYNPDSGTAVFSSIGAPGGKDQLVIRAPDGSFTVVGPVAPPSSPESGAPTLKWASSDLSHVLFEDNSFDLDWPFDTSLQGGLDHRTLLEYEGSGNSEPFLVGVSGGRGSNDLVSECSTRGTALSPDGRIVVFEVIGHLQDSCPPTATAPAANQVLARIDASETVLLSGRSPSNCTIPSCQSSAPRNARFISASDDASKVLFTSTQQLTDTATQGSNNLYLYDFAQPAGHELIDVSSGGSGGAGPGVQDAGALSADGSHTYFVSAGALGGGLDGKGQPPVEGGINLYAYERDAAHPSGQLSFVATLPESDRDYWKDGRSGANVTPDGRFLVFPSHGRLTADDASESGAAQIFRYDAQNDQLLRISIGEGGFNDNGNAGAPSLCAGQSGGCPADASLPPITPLSSRTDPTMSHDGAYVFFQSPAALTPQALDFSRRPGGVEIYGQNVYEYHAGHVYLISDGKDALAGGSLGVLIGADADGSNVFFKTFDALVPGDADGGQLDLYDARVDGGFAAPSQPVPCQGDTCRGAATQAPPGQTPASSTFDGPGNLAPRHQGKKPQRKKHQHKKRHQHKRAAGNHGRTNR